MFDASYKKGKEGKFKECIEEFLRQAFKVDQPNIATASDTTTYVAPTNTTPTITNSSTSTVPPSPLIFETPTLQDTLGTPC